MPTFSASVSPTPSPDGECPYLRALADVGASSIEWMSHFMSADVLYDEADAERARALGERHGLSIASVHGFWGVEDEEVFVRVNRNRAEFLGRAGGPGTVLVLHLPVRRDLPDLAATIASTRSLLDRIRTACAASGVRAAVETLYDVKQYGAPYFDALFRAYPADFLGMCYDSGHAAIRGREALVEEFNDRLIATHLHDCDGENDSHVTPGLGVVDWGRVIRAVERAPLPGPVNFEVNMPAGEDLDKFVKRAYAGIDALWRQHAGHPLQRRPSAEQPAR